MATIFVGITTYNRIDYLEKTITSLLVTRNNKHNWIMAAADDGSTDGSIQLLKKHGFRIFRHNRYGVHHQTNVLLKFASETGFDFGFMLDDDLIFKRPNWDNKYIEAIKKTEFDHLNFHDPRWKRKRTQRSTIHHESGLLECKAYWFDTQGAFWTFTPAVIKNVGFFDIENFKVCGLGHRDYTFRCCKAGFNIFKNIFDITNSFHYLQLNLNKNNYESAPDRNLIFDMWRQYSPHKQQKLHDDRIYVPYNETPVNCFNEPIITAHPACIKCL
jgi:glycosyltransferase involved in cell wall biosynthesis